MLDGKLPEGRIHVWQTCGGRKTNKPNKREAAAEEESAGGRRKRKKRVSLAPVSGLVFCKSHIFSCVCLCVCSAVSNSVCLWIQLCPTLCECVQLCAILRYPTDCSLPGFSVHRFFQARSRLPFPIPGDLPYPGIQPESPALAGGFFTTESPGKPFLDFSLTCKNYNRTDSEMKQSSVLPKKLEEGKKRRTEEVRRKKKVHLEKNPQGAKTLYNPKLFSYSPLL